MGRIARVACLLVMLSCAVLAAPALAAAGPLEPLGAWGTDVELGSSVESIAATETGAIAVADRRRDRVVVFAYDRSLVGAFDAEDPRGLAAVPGGGYLIAEKHGVRRVDATGNSITTYDARKPYGVVLAGDVVLIADAADGRILRYRLDGSPLDPWDARLRDARGLAVGPDGTVFAANHRAWRIETFSAAGEHTGGWWVPDPHGVAVSADGIVYVAASRAGKLKWFGATGDFLGSLRTGSSRPRGVTVDCRGTVTVAGDSTPRLEAYGDPAVPPPPCLAPPPPVLPVTVAPPPPPPVQQLELPDLGRTAAVTPVSGTVFVGEGQDRRRLTGRTIVPMATQLDATDGEVELVLETVAQGFQRGVFSEGAFTVHQGRERSLVELRLTGEAPAAGDAARATVQRKRRRRVWGSADGEFRTSGRHGAATVRGTRWLTEDRPDGTFIRVVEGSVLAEAFEREQRRVLDAGESFLARPACASRRNFRIRLRVPIGTSVRDARVIVAGRRVAVSRGNRLTAPIDLRGLRRGEVNVRIRIVTTTGAVLRENRTYQTCVGARG
jgi:hypothetical protein